MSALAVTALVEALLYLSHYNQQRTKQRLARNARITHDRAQRKLGGRHAC